MPRIRSLHPEQWSDEDFVELSYPARLLAIGIRKHVSKLDFVDKKRLSKGVDLDAKVQLVLVAVKEGHTPDLAALAKAVDDAGYDPVILYRLNGGALKTSNLTVPKG